MFDLEKSIMQWRQQMLAAGIQSPVPLEELENHLREEIERQMQSGSESEKAFEISVQKIGAAHPLKSEFKKIERPSMKTIKICAQICGTVIGAALFVPGAIQLHDELVINNGKLLLWLTGMALCAGSLDWMRRTIWPRAVVAETEKIKTPLLKQMFKVRAGVMVLLAGLAFMTPAMAQAGRDGAMKFENVCFLMFGLALLLAGAGVTFFPYQKRKA